MSYTVKNFTEQGGEVTHIGGKLIIEEGAEVTGLDGGGGGSSYTLPVTSKDTLGGVLADTKGAGDTVEVKADETGKLYVPTYPEDYTLPAATEEALGGVKAGAKTEGDTVEVKVDGEGKPYVPTYPTVPQMENQKASTASEATELMTDFNNLLEKLKTSGLMKPDSE